MRAASRTSPDKKTYATPETLEKHAAALTS